MDSFLHFLLVSLPILCLLYLIPKIIKSKSKSSDRYQLHSPPGPRGLPFIGNLHQIDKSNLHTSLWSLSKSYGPVVSLKLGFIPAVVVSSANVAKEILKTQDLTFCSRPSFHGLKRVTYNGVDVALSPYNQNWKEMRRIFTVYRSV
ncbi:cytochrome P450 71A1-like protein [Tanacetum coccineum]